jgi:uncharacterized membrane protein
MLFGLSLLLAYVITSIIPSLSPLNPEIATVGDHFLILYGSDNLSEVLEVGFSRRQETLPGILTLTLLIGLALSALWPRENKKEKQISASAAFSPATTFALVLILFGGLLVIIPEFVFLRDQFNTRMNTIFKFYFQAWMLWGAATAYGSAILLGEPRRSPWPWFYSLILVITLTIGLTYPLMAVETQLHNFTQNSENTLQLDGAVDFARYSTEDKAATDWLKDAPLGTLVEAVGGSFTHYARIATYSGQPSLLGWPGHESQWRGGGAEMGTRAQDIERLYTTSSWAEANQIITSYGIRYIYIGSLERITYNVSEGKFNRYLEPAYQQGQVTIYEVPELTIDTNRNE